jgi:hypothetical protein
MRVLAPIILRRLLLRGKALSCHLHQHLLGLTRK